MTTTRTKPLEQWSTEKWTGDRRLPRGYVVTNVLDKNGASEIVAWVPQRDRAELIARLPEIETLASIAERLATALRTSAPERQPVAVRRLLDELNQIRTNCSGRKSISAA